MSDISLIIDATHVDHYYTGNPVPTTIPINTYDPSLEVNVFRYNDRLKWKTDSLIAYKLESTDPGFTLLKVFKLMNTERLVFRNESEVLYEHIYYQMVNGVKIYLNSYHHNSIVRIEYVISPMTKSAEIYVHEGYSGAHYKDAKYVDYEISGKLVNKNLIDNMFCTDISSTVNGTLIDKSMKLIYLGNLISDRFNME
jgi:hypothetical protein